MPTEGTHTDDKYSDVLDEIFEIMQKFKEYTPIWVGDLNANPHRLKSSNDKRFAEFIKEESLLIAGPDQSTPTYHHFNKTSKSTIDLFLTRKNKAYLIMETTVDCRNPANFSAHDAVTAKTKAALPPPTSMKKIETQENTPKRKTNWSRVDKVTYQERTEPLIESLLLQIHDDTPTDVIITRLNNIVTQCCESATPSQPKSRSKKSKYKWFSELRELMKTNKQAYWAWKKEGKPTSPDNPYLQQHKQCKQALIKAQRQLSARQRQEKYSMIMSATPQELPKLIKQQRVQNHHKCSIDFETHKEDTEADSWASYFEDLSTPKDNPNFDKEYWIHTQTKHLLLSLLNNIGEIQEVSQETISKHIKNLKNNKAQDVYGVSAEHLKHASPKIDQVITIATNRILKSGTLPDSMKTGIVTPVLKKDKTAKNPDSYRRITVTSLIGKVVEKEILDRTKLCGKDNRSNLQFGFTEGVAPITAAMIITEAICQAQNNKEILTATFMDASKAFDIVCHSSLLNTLADHGIQGNLWSLYHSMYSDINGMVKWRNQVSRPFKDKQGLRQGGSTSAEVFNRRSDSVLKQIENIPNCSKIGIQPINVVMVADDMALLSTTKLHMQIAIDKAETDAAQKRYIFSDSKTKSVEILPRQNKKTNVKCQNHFTLNSNPIPVSTEETHLGIPRSATNSMQPILEKRMSSARRAAYSLFGAGFHGLNGVGPEAIRKQWVAYIQPTLSYGLESLLLKDTDIKCLELFTRQMLRRLQYLPQSTSVPAIHLLFGIPPIEATIHIQILTFLANICRRRDSVEQYIISRQAVMCEPDEKSWVNQAKKTLRLYNLPSIFTLLECTPSKSQWKTTVKKAVLAVWEKNLKEEAEEKTSLRYLNLSKCSLTRPHPAWGTNLTDPRAIVRATVKIQLLTLRYPLTAYSVSGKKKSLLCPLCSEEPETAEHFVTQCPALSSCRQPLLAQILGHLRRHKRCLTSLTSFVLDPPEEDHYQAAELEALTRNYCFRLHKRRQCILDGIKTC